MSKLEVGFWTETRRKRVRELLWIGLSRAVIAERMGVSGNQLGDMIRAYRLNQPERTDG